MRLYNVQDVILMRCGAADDNPCAALGSMSCHQPGAIDRVKAEVDRFNKRFGDDEATRARKRDVIVEALRLTFCPKDFKDFYDVEGQLKAEHVLDEDDITYDGIIGAYVYLENSHPHISVFSTPPGVAPVFSRPGELHVNSGVSRV